MANKNVNILLKLKDQFTPKLKGTTKEIKAQKAAINAASKTINKWGSTANAKFKSVMSSAGRLGASIATLGGAISVAGIANFAKEAMEGFNAAQEAETKLEAVLNNVPSIIAKGDGAAAAAKDNLVKLTDQMEEAGVIAGDVSVAGLQQLATFQLTEESLAKLAPGMADLIAQQKGLNATQGDAVSIGNLVGKAMTGQTGALSKAGIIMSDYQAQVMKTGSETERAAMMAEILKQNVGGVNSALAQTDAGKIAVAQNLIGRTSDLIGEKLMSVKGQLADLLIQYMPDIQRTALDTINKIDTWVSENKDTIVSAFQTAAQIGKTAFTVLSGAISFFIKNANWLIPVLAGVASGFAAFNVITRVSGLFTSFAAVVKGASAAGGILKLVMASLPFSPVVAGIAAVIGILVALIVKFDKVRAAAALVIRGIVSLVTTLGYAFVVLGRSIKDSIVGAFNFVKGKVKAVFDWFKQKIDWLKEKLKGLGNGDGDGPPAPPNPYGGHATGTPYFAGGPTRINEGGRGEIVDLPNGTRIIPHDVSKKSVGGGSSITVNLTVQGNVIGNRAFMEQTGSYIANKILAAQGVV